MKTPSVVGLVVAAVLLTIAIEETRISRLRNEKQKPAPAMADTGENLRSSDSVSETADNGPVRTKTRAELKPAAAETNREAADEPILRTVRKMWDNPAGKSMMNQGLKIAVAMMYEDFIEDLNLTKEEADYFKTLLGKEMADQQELGMKMMGASDEERKELVAEIEQRKTANDEDIRKFLNNDADYQRYRDHKDRLPERQQLDGIRSAMAGKDAPLDADM